MCASDATSAMRLKKAPTARGRAGPGRRERARPPIARLLAGHAGSAQGPIAAAANAVAATPQAAESALAADLGSVASRESGSPTTRGYVIQACFGGVLSS